MTGTPPSPSLAQALLDSPTPEVEDAKAAAQEASASSESQSVISLIQEDGSILTVTSFQGGDPVLTVFDDELHAAREPVPVPRTDQSPPPQGLGSDGVLRDENGDPVDGEDVG